MIENNLRTCVSCRGSDDRTKLFRFVRSNDGELCFDAKKQLLSRGAWVCASRNCIIKANEKKLFFKNEPVIKVNSDELLKTIERKLENQILSSLGLMRKMGKIRAGREDVFLGINKEDTKAVILSLDLSNKTKKEVEFKALKKYVSVFELPIGMAELGKSIGRKPTGVVGLNNSSIIKDILFKIKILSDLKV